ncbi:MAG: hypothetical protein Q8Q29_05865, partial [Actinomycetota bacterium]|nr:hypothetical protein [Actinomycetota bacterium]
MKLFADTPARRIRQILVDLLFLVWILSWVAIGTSVHGGTMALADPGHRIDRSATNLGDSMTEAGDVLSGIPLVGDGASAPFAKASEASQSLAAAGRAEVAAVERLALWLGLSIGAIPILVVAAFYLPRRLRFIREATAGQAFIDSEADEDLFAWRAMANQPLPALARITDDPVGAVLRGERDMIRQLAALEMRDVGLV